MILISINMFVRASEMTKYCPLAEDIVLPIDVEDWCSDGFPRYLKLQLNYTVCRESKGALHYVSLEMSLPV